MTPFVPVLLALFAVIAVTASPSVAALKIDMIVCNLPPPPDASRPIPPEPIFVSLEGDGTYRINSAIAASDAFAKVAADLAAQRHQGAIYVRADANVSYSRVMSAVRSLRGVGLQIQFINEDVS